MPKRLKGGRQNNNKNSYMKKLILFLVAMICCQYSFGQSISLEEAIEAMSHLYYGDMRARQYFYVSDGTQDAAYEAPNSALTKKWFFCPDDQYSEFENGYVQFYPNGTLKKYAQYQGFHGEWTGKWSRSKQDLKLTFNYTTVKCSNDDLSGYSLRKKDEINQERIKKQAQLRKLGVCTEIRPIRRLDDLMVLDYGDDAVFLCGYLVAEDFLVKKAEEAKKKTAEEAAKEADNLNEKAYEFAENDNFGEAIATIDKAINLCPNDPNYYDSKGEILYNMGDKDGAKGMWDKVVSLDPKYSEKNTILYKFLFNPEIFNESESDLNSFEEIANRLIRKKNGENVTITNEDYEKFQNLVDKLKKSPYTFKQKKRIREIAKKLQ